MSRVFVIGDTHWPATHPGYLEFCQDMYEQWNCDRVVHIGDAVDFHCYSRFTKETDAPGEPLEIRQARAHAAEWIAAFPAADVIEGNHCRRIKLRASEVGISPSMVRSVPDIFDFPEEWVWHAADEEDEPGLEIDGVWYTHGTGITASINPAYSLVRRLGQSCVMGHIHHASGVKTDANRNRTRFAVDTGCGIDIRHPFMRYGKQWVQKPVLSCAIILDGEQAFVETMRCGEGEPYHRDSFSLVTEGTV